MTVANRFLTSLRNLVADNGHTFYFASPGYSTNKVVTGGAGAVTITVPTDGNGNAYKGVTFSAQGALFYINAFGTATGSGSNQTAGIADLENPAQLTLVNADSTVAGLGSILPGAAITSFTLYAPITCTVFMRWFS